MQCITIYTFILLINYNKSIIVIKLDGFSILIFIKYCYVMWFIYKTLPPAANEHNIKARIHVLDVPKINL